MIPGGALGVLGAWLLADVAPEWAVQAVLGAVSLVFALWQGVLQLRGAPGLAAAHRHERVLALSAGAAGGFTSAIAHAGSPPFQIYVMPKGLAKEV
ncbi:hypothetical protein ACQ5SO_05070 [Rhodovulum sp. DZ06]|uniref:hypothetical protein n=1 Tax=Rhodovulum sp. DZ06 TaxID=3425126 RepID=UPI003D340AEE